MQDVRQKSQGHDLNAGRDSDCGIFCLTALTSFPIALNPLTPRGRRQPGLQHTALSHWSLRRRNPILL